MRRVAASSGICRLGGDGKHVLFHAGRPYCRRLPARKPLRWRLLLAITMRFLDTAGILPVCDPGPQWLAEDLKLAQSAEYPCSERYQTVQRAQSRYSQCALRRWCGGVAVRAGDRWRGDAGC